MRKDEIQIGKHYAVRHRQRTIVVLVQAAPTGRRRRFICKSMKTGRAVRIDPVNFKRETPLEGFATPKPDLRSPQQKAFEREYEMHCQAVENPMTRDEYRAFLEENSKLCET